MLNVKPQNLLEEIQASQKVTDAVMAGSRELVLAYQGRHHRNDEKPNAPVPEPHHFEWLAQNTPLVVFDNPQFQVNATTIQADRTEMLQLKHAVNKIIRDQDAWQTFLRGWYNCYFSSCIFFVTPQPVPGWPADSAGRRRVRPVIRLIPPHRFGMDALCTDHRDARFKYHSWRRDLDDLLEDPLFNRKAVEQLNTDDGHDRFAPHQNAQGVPDRKQVVGYEVWVPEYHLPAYRDREGYHGTIFTIGTSVSNEKQDDGKQVAGNLYLRDPRPFFGPKHGPYMHGDIYHIPDSAYPLAIAKATEEQSKALQTQVSALVEAASSFKRFTAIDSGAEENEGVVRTVPNGGVCILKGLAEKNVQTLEQGGASQGQYQAVNDQRDRYDRATGLNDSGRGLADPNVTATADANASAARSTRIDFVKKQFQNCVQKVGYAVAFYAWHTDTVREHLGPDAAEELAPRPGYLPPESQAEQVAMRDYDVIQNLHPDQDPFEVVREQLQWPPRDHPSMTFQGGLEGRRGSFDDLAINIEPMSMERTNEPLMQKRKLEWLEAWIKAAPLFRQYPEIKFEDLMNQVGHAMNQQDAGDLVDAGFLAVLRQQLTAGMDPSQAQAPAPGEQPGVGAMAPQRGQEPGAMTHARQNGAMLASAVGAA